jgi:hypothetical protein
MKTNILKRNVRPKKAAVKRNGKSISKARAVSLNNIIAGFKRRKIISSTNSINKSVLLLFTGGGNDNKIMAAEYVADMLGKKVYRVGLSEVASKYIGETEKNLNKFSKKLPEKIGSYSLTRRMRCSEKEPRLKTLMTNTPTWKSATF